MIYSTNTFPQNTPYLYEILSETFRLIKKKFSLSFNYKAPTRKNIFNFIFILFLGFLAVSMIATEVEKENGLRVINLTTGSMRPTIPLATIVVTVPSEEYRLGDIVTYRDENKVTGVAFARTFTHRIINVENKGNNTVYITKGDSNNFPDPHKVEKSQVLGKAILIIPYLGYLFLAIKSIPGFLTLIAIPSILLIKSQLIYILSLKRV